MAFAQHAGVWQWYLKYGNMMLRALVDNTSAQLYPLQLDAVVVVQKINGCWVADRCSGRAT